MFTLRIKVGGKRIHGDVSSTHMDPEIRVQKWKYVLQIRISTETELGEEVIDCKEIMKVDGLMKIVFDDGPSYEKSVKKLRKMYDIIKWVKLSSSTFN